MKTLQSSARFLAIFEPLAFYAFIIFFLVLADSRGRSLTYFPFILLGGLWLARIHSQLILMTHRLDNLDHSVKATSSARPLSEASAESRSLDSGAQSIRKLIVAVSVFTILVYVGIIIYRQTGIVGDLVGRLPKR